MSDQTPYYTIVEHSPTMGQPWKTPFTALVLNNGRVEEFDPRPSAPWSQTRGDCVRAVNAQHSGAHYLPAEKFDNLVAK